MAMDAWMEGLTERGGRKEEVQQSVAKGMHCWKCLMEKKEERGRKRRSGLVGEGEIQYACWKQAAVTAEMDKASYWWIKNVTD